VRRLTALPRALPAPQRNGKSAFSMAVNRGELALVRRLRT
jgi:hypothetical protein